jgi:co-chaperonin GroES (HSP10)
MEHRTGGNNTNIKDGGVRGMAVVQEGKEVKALGKYIIGRVETGGNKTEGGLYLPDNAVAERVFVESIGANVNTKNKDGRELKVGDEIVVMSIAKIPVWDPLKQVTRDLVVYDEGNVIGIIE